MASVVSRPTEQNFIGSVVIVIGFIEPSVVPASLKTSSIEGPKLALYKKQATITQTPAGCVLCCCLVHYTHPAPIGVSVCPAVEQGGGQTIGCVRTKAYSAIFGQLWTFADPHYVPSFSLFSNGTLNEQRWDLRLFFLQRCDFIRFCHLELHTRRPFLVTTQLKALICRLYWRPVSDWLSLVAAGL